MTQKGPNLCSKIDVILKCQLFNLQNAQKCKKSKMTKMTNRDKNEQNLQKCSENDAKGNKDMF